MMKTNKEFALKTAIELAKVNIDSHENWTHPEDVTLFLEEVYSFLVGEKGTGE